MIERGDENNRGVYYRGNPNPHTFQGSDRRIFLFVTSPLPSSENTRQSRMVKVSARSKDIRKQRQIKEAQELKNLHERVEALVNSLLGIVV